MSVAQPHTEDANGIKLAGTLYLGLGNADCTGRLKVGTGFFYLLFFLLPVLRTESLAEVLIN